MTAVAMDRNAVAAAGRERAPDGDQVRPLLLAIAIHLAGIALSVWLSGPPG
jgi:hypothetical protein